MIDFSEAEITTLFRRDPFYCEKEIKSYSYKCINDYGFSLVFYLECYDKVAHLRLTYKRFIDPIFDLRFNRVLSVSGKNNTLKLMLANDRNCIVIFDPNFSMTLNKQ